MKKVYIEDAAHNRIAEIKLENRNVKVVLLRKGYSVRMDEEPDNVIEVKDDMKSEEKVG